MSSCFVGGHGLYNFCPSGIPKPFLWRVCNLGNCLHSAPSHLANSILWNTDFENFLDTREQMNRIVMTAPECLPSSWWVQLSRHEPTHHVIIPQHLSASILSTWVMTDTPQGDLERQVLKMAELPISPEAQDGKNCLQCRRPGLQVPPDLSLFPSGNNLCWICAHQPRLSSQQVSLSHM